MPTEKKQADRQNIHLDAIIAIRDHNWYFAEHGTRKLLVPPQGDERRDWAAIWSSEGYPHWLPRYSEGEE